jgi:hypothetical protein
VRPDTRPHTRGASSQNYLAKSSAFTHRHMTAPDYIANVTSKNPCMRGLTKQQIRIFSLPHKVYPTKRCSGRPPIQDIQLQQHNRIGAKTTGDRITNIVAVMLKILPRQRRGQPL